MYYEVYVDILFLENLWMDAELLVLTAKLFRKPLHAGRILAAAIAGKPGGLFADDWFGMDQQSRLFSGEPVSGSADDGHRFWKRKTFQTDGGRALSGMFSHGRLSQVCRPVYRLNGMCS